MTDKARELLAASVRRGSDTQARLVEYGKCAVVDTDDAIHAINAALRTAAEGMSSVPIDLLDRFPEINPSNYSHDDVCALNAWGVELVLAAAQEGRDG